MLLPITKVCEVINLFKRRTLITVFEDSKLRNVNLIDNLQQLARR